MILRYLTWMVLLVSLCGGACTRHDDKHADTGASVAAPANASTAPSAPVTATPPVALCEHAVPKALCPKCNPALVPVFKARGDWCEEHGFPESFCPICKPGAKFPEVGAAPAQPADWCGGHQVPESKCTKCNPELIPKFKASGDWCDEHGFPESVCPLCNAAPAPAPTAAGSTAADWCVEHAVPESKCTKCNADLIPKFKAAGDWCNEHGFPESVCPVCNPQPPPAGAEQAAIEARIVRFKSPEIEEAAGIRTVAARVGKAATSTECTARIAFNSDRVAEVRALVPGVVRNVRIELGQQVKRGAPLFDLESTQVGQVQAELQSARARVASADANLARKRELRDSQIASVRQVEVAEQELASAQAEARAAESALRLAGAAQAAPSGRYTLTAPIAGTVVRRPAVVGLLATESASLAVIGDVSSMWALCDVPEADAARLALGQKMSVVVDGAASEVEGKLTWIAAEVDPRTRTVTARAEVPNAEGRLRANQFSHARIETSEARTAVTVPRASVQRVGSREVVFVRTNKGVYEPRVVTRFGAGESVQVEGRVREGEAIVTTGAILLRTEIMPGSIGAGCCETEHEGGK